MKKILITMCLLGCFTSCDAALEEPVSSTSEEITKAEAATLAKNDSAKDYCQVYSWYGDGACDAFCEKPDPDCTVAVKVCGDGSDLTCKRAEPRCGKDQISEIVNGCYGDCVDVKTCLPTVGTICGDGSQLTCKRAVPVCPEGQISEIINGCYGECVSPKTCDPVVVSAACGTRGSSPCPDGQFCEFEINAACGSFDLGGSCVTAPEACTKEYAPVCGCDGVTYGNACMAKAASASVVSLGECVCGDGSQLMCRQSEPVCPRGQIAEIVNGCYGACVDADTCNPVSCGGRGGAMCADGEFCNFDIPAQCGQFDAPGACTEVPEACTKQYDPVCGCDGVTYGNACMAQAASASVISQGACTCGDGSQLACRRLEPNCGEGKVAEIVNGCYGVCVDENTCAPAACGGFAGIQCVAGNCVDDPNDNCDPKNGGADCIGYCEIK